MRKEARNIGEEYRKASMESFALVARSLSEVNKGLQKVASEMTEYSKSSVDTVIDLQAQLAKNAYDTYVSQVSNLGRMILVGYGALITRTEELPQVSLIQEGGASRSQAAAQRTAAHSIPAKRKTDKARRRRPGGRRASKT
jgi:hypothetical protein